MRKPNKDIQLTTYQDLLGVEENTGAGTEKVVIAPLIELFDFKDHPFKVLDDEKMEETTESIRQHGVCTCSGYRKNENRWRLRVNCRTSKEKRF